MRTQCSYPRVDKQVGKVDKSAVKKAHLMPATLHNNKCSAFVKRNSH